MISNRKKRVEKRQHLLNEIKSFEREIILVAVSKKQSVDQIVELYTQGVSHFGENYLQEAEKKIKTLNQSLSSLGVPVWHYIGEVQSKKIKKIVENFDWVHSLSDLSHLELFEKHCLLQNKTIKGLIQVNLFDEKTKGGVCSNQLPQLLEVFLKQKWFQFQGFMFMPPLVQSEEEQIRQYELIFSWKEKILPFLPNKNIHWSMGTSLDFRIALRYGATLLRLGTVLFGERVV